MKKILLAIVILIPGCTEIHQTAIPTSEKSNDSTDYVDNLDVHFAEQYREQRNNFFQDKIKNSIGAETRMPKVSDPRSIRLALFGADEKCLEITSHFMRIHDAFDDIHNVFSTILNLQDKYGDSCAHENYQYSLASREYMNLFFSDISRYLKIVKNGFRIILGGILLSDEKMISAGFNIIALEEAISTEIRNKYRKLIPLVKKGSPKNLRLFFKEVSKDIPELRKEIQSVGKLYADICSKIIDHNAGRLFFDNSNRVKNIEKNMEHFLNWLIVLKNYCEN